MDKLEFSPLRLKPFRRMVSFLIRTVGIEEAKKVPPESVVEALKEINKDHPAYKEYLQEWKDWYDQGQDNRDG